MQEAMAMIRKAEVEERRLYTENTIADQLNTKDQRVTRSKMPPAPLLLCRTDTSMVLKPAPFEPSGGKKVEPLH